MIRKMIDAQTHIDTFDKDETITARQLSEGNWVHGMSCGSNMHIYRDVMKTGYELIVEESYRGSGTYRVQSCYKD
jgi:hypothetical protein